jgi:3'-phosphoadenosine 5'-phosphosulfate sulfotransferase (PAPS reductase)/FAD synthetase
MTDTTAAELAYLRSLVKKLFYYLDYQEESDGGKMFHPVTISCCRALMTQPLNELLDEMKTVVTEETP